MGAPSQKPPLLLWRDGVAPGRPHPVVWASLTPAAGTYFSELDLVTNRHTGPGMCSTGGYSKIPLLDLGYRENAQKTEDGQTEEGDDSICFRAFCGARFKFFFAKLVMIE